MNDEIMEELERLEPDIGEEIAKMKSRVKRAPSYLTKTTVITSDLYDKLATLRAQQAEIAAMKLALIPFSEMYAEAVKYAAAELAGPYSDFDKPWESRPTFGDLRRAAQALESTERGERE